MRTLPRVLSFVLPLLTPSAVLAEVMDKETPPWTPGRLVPLTILTALCGLAAKRSGRARTLLAAVLAAGWAVIGLISDDLYDPFVRTSIRAELSPFAFQAYRVLAPVEALIPLVVVAAVVSWRTRRAS